MKQGYQVPSRLGAVSGCFVKKNPNINKTQTKNPHHKHNIDPTKPQCSPFQQFRLFCCLCLTFLHPQKSSEGQQEAELGKLLTGATGIQSSWAAITGNISPLSHHQYSRDYSLTRYCVITSPLSGHKTARCAVSGRNCSTPPKLNFTVLLFKTIP